jgi:hypothetical protein
MRKAVAIVLTLVVVASVALAVVVFLPRTLRSLSIYRAKSRWERASLADYTWRVDTECFGACTNGAPIQIVVRAGKPVHVSGARASSVEGTPMTIEQLFRRVEEEVGAEGYSVTFDSELGFPTVGRFDPSRNTQDDEWGFTVVGLHAD